MCIPMRSPPYGDRLRQYDAPNAVWCADFKGCFPPCRFKMSPTVLAAGNTIRDRCRPGTTGSLRGPQGGCRRRIDRIASTMSVPRAIRTDNGPPFSTLAPAGLSRLAVWWIRLGIRPERIMPGRPDRNGRHERVHSTLKAETAKPPRSSFRAQQRAFDRFQLEYNDERPHEALGQQVRASLYRPSLRSYPSYLPQPEYPAHFETRRRIPYRRLSSLAFRVSPLALSAPLPAVAVAAATLPSPSPYPSTSSRMITSHHPSPSGR
jgi:integrase-like protein